MRRMGFKVINYVDDFVRVVARRSYDALHQLMRQLGLDVSAKKLVSPSTSVWASLLTQLTPPYPYQMKS